MYISIIYYKIYFFNCLFKLIRIFFQNIVNIKNMNIKNFINNLFEQNYNFSIINNNNEKVKPINNNHTSIYLEINKNL